MANNNKNSVFKVDKSVLKLGLIELLYREGLVNKESYYKAKSLLRSEARKE